jgi:FtsP/CotA-like multicopper oxidase with cupredoxin domain
MSEMDPLWHEDSVMEHPHDTTQSVHEVFVPEYHPSYFLVNGMSEQELLNPDIAFQSAKEQVSLLRMANIGYLANRVAFPTELNAKIISTDGRPIESPEISDTLWLSPGERYGVLVEPNVDLIDSITISYINMNSLVTENTQYIPVNVSGTNGLIEDEDNKTFKLYPNPSRNRFHLKSIGVIYDGVKIYDAMGRLLQTVNIENASLGNIEVKSDLPAGVYTVEVILDEHVLDSIKWINQ